MLLSGAAGRSRTGDLRITNALLYQLSYSGVGANYTVVAVPRANRGFGLSAIPEGRFAFLHERGHPLLLVFDRKAGVEQPSLDAYTFSQYRLESAVD